MPEALARVKRDIGPDAVILGTRTLPAGGLGGLVGRQCVEITVSTASHGPPRVVSGATPGPRAADRAQIARDVAAARSAQRARRAARALGAPAGPVLTEAVPDALEPSPIERAQGEVAEALARRLAEEAAAEGRADAATCLELVRRTIRHLMPAVGGVALTAGRCSSVALVGPPGCGKTTTIAKLAAHFALRMKKRVALLSLDVHRLATHAQVRRYAELIGVPLLAVTSVSAARDALAAAQPFDLLLIDTPGVGPRDRGRLARLAALLRGLRPDAIHLALPASLTLAAQQRLAALFGPLGPSRLVLTRLDEAVGLGVVLGAIDRLQLDISYVTDGQNVPRDLTAACSPRLAELLCRVGS